MNGNWSLILSILASIVLLSVIIQIKAKRPNWLDIETKWLAISAFPILIGLFLGGYITSFKGLGIEIEASLREPVSTIVPLVAKKAKAASALIGETSTLKGSVTHLLSLPEEEKRSIERLVFKNKYPSYSSKAIKTYINNLSNLEYIELLDENSKFIGVMLASDLIGKESQFVDSLRSGNILIDFSKFIVTNYVDSNTSALDALDRMRRNNAKYLPLLNESHTMEGVVTESSLEKSIAAEVLKASRKS